MSSLDRSPIYNGAGGPGRIRVGVGTPLALAAVALFMLLALAPVTAAAQAALPDVHVVLVLEVRDTAGWLALHDQVLRTSSRETTPLGVSVAPGGPRRAITLNEPRFSVSFVRGSRSFGVTITGKVAGGEAVTGLGAFKLAILETQAFADGQIELFYGLSSVAAHVVEMHLTRE